jgi:two-component system, cell cycle response regulator
VTAPTILTVDDSRVLRLSLVELFRPFDCRVLQAADGAEGLAALREHRPDLVLLDYNMPVLDGIGMLREMRADPGIARTSVIMLTANAAPQTLAQVARLGVRDYVVKPHDGPALLAKAARLLRLLPRVSAADEPAPHD